MQPVKFLLDLSEVFSIDFYLLLKFALCIDSFINIFLILLFLVLVILHLIDYIHKLLVNVLILLFFLGNF